MLKVTGVDGTNIGKDTNTKTGAQKIQQFSGVAEEATNRASACASWPEMSRSNTAESGRRQQPHPGLRGGRHPHAKRALRGRRSGFANTLPKGQTSSLISAARGKPSTSTGERAAAAPFRATVGNHTSKPNEACGHGTGPTPVSSPLVASLLFHQSHLNSLELHVWSFVRANSRFSTLQISGELGISSKSVVRALKRLLGLGPVQGYPQCPLRSRDAAGRRIQTGYLILELA